VRRGRDASKRLRGRDRSAAVLWEKKEAAGENRRGQSRPAADGNSAAQRPAQTIAAGQRIVRPASDREGAVSARARCQRGPNKQVGAGAQGQPGRTSDEDFAARRIRRRLLMDGRFLRGLALAGVIVLDESRTRRNTAQQESGQHRAQDRRQAARELRISWWTVHQRNRQSASSGLMDDDAAGNVTGLLSKRQWLIPWRRRSDGTMKKLCREKVA